MEDVPAAAWHEALVFAVTGKRHAGLGRQRRPDVSVVLDTIGPGPYGAHAVPADLMVGIGSAQFAAVVADLRRRLAAGLPAPVLADRALDAGERRLQADVPPHH